MSNSFQISMGPVSEFMPNMMLIQQVIKLEQKFSLSQHYSLPGAQPIRYISGHDYHLQKRR